MEPASKITLLFAGFGILAGAISGFIPSAGAALVLALFFYYGAYRFALSMFGIGKPSTPTPPTPALPASRLEQKPAQLPDKKKILTSGFIPFFVMWLIAWIMLYTILLV